MDNARVRVGTDESVYGKDEELIVGSSGFKGMPDVDCVLVVGVKDDLRKVMMFVEDRARDSEGFVIENVVGLVLIWDVELVP